MSPTERSSQPSSLRHRRAATLAAGLVVAVVLAAGFSSAAPQARALPEAGTDILPVAVEASVTSRLGSETISFTGEATIVRGDPELVGGVERVSAEITALDLTGTSQIGPITVNESSTLTSAGEIRSLQPPPDQFPASSFLDLFVQVVVPANPTPTLILHNEAALRVVPVGGNGDETSLLSWPPLGVTYAVEPNPCVPLLPALPANVCVTALSVTIQGEPPATPTTTPTPLPSRNTTFSVEAGGPSGADPAGLLQVGPSAAAACTQLGLTADGCDSGADGDEDDVDALSFGMDFEEAAQPAIFSVASGSDGLPGTGVSGQAGCSPAQPQADTFVSDLDGDNTLLADGDGLGGACPTAPSFGLIETPVSDDLDALEGHPPSAADVDGDGVPEAPVFLSLRGGSPTLGELDRVGGDILWTIGGAQPGLYASAATLGLGPVDEVDAICVLDDGNAIYEPSIDRVIFSLAPGSPRLSAIGAGQADLLAPGPRIVLNAAALGLQSGDDVDALACGADLLGIVLPPTPTPTATFDPTATQLPATETPAPSATPQPTTTAVAVSLPQAGQGGAGAGGGQGSWAGALLLVAGTGALLIYARGRPAIHRR